MKVLQILPRVPPAVCGIGDYAWGIARRLREEHGIASSFLSAGTSWSQPEGETEFPVFRLPQLTAQALMNFMAARAGEHDAVVLHMSPYGYQKRGVPLWLAAGWRRIAAMKAAPRMITMFHELYASGPPTSSAFWLQPLQKHILRQVARASGGLRTNREAYADWLRSQTGRGVVAMPVFSNFGEPPVLPEWEQREPAMAVFAWGIHSGESLEQVVAKAASWAGRFGMKRLHLIGGAKFAGEVGHGIELVRLGFMAAADVAALLGSCRMAYTAYSPLHFGKSTLIAAFAAHGLPVITQGSTNDLPDGLRHGLNVLNEPFLTASGLPVDGDLRAIGGALRSWYDGHSLAANAQSYAEQMKDEG